MNNNTSAVGRSWKSARKELFTEEEITQSDLRVAIISKQIKTRQQGLEPISCNDGEGFRLALSGGN
jgi:hypothetical protein